MSQSDVNRQVELTAFNGMIFSQRAPCYDHCVASSSNCLFPPSSWYSNYLLCIKDNGGVVWWTPDRRG
ncbi:hypothetical protein VTO42DRAFT_1830 [Malbranchea cinnamomea]